MIRLLNARLLDSWLLIYRLLTPGVMHCSLDRLLLRIMLLILLLIVLAHSDCSLTWLLVHESWVAHSIWHNRERALVLHSRLYPRLYPMLLNRRWSPLLLYILLLPILMLSLQLRVRRRRVMFIVFVLKHRSCPIQRGMRDHVFGPFLCCYAAK